jgi:hypothetical protein
MTATDFNTTFHGGNPVDDRAANGRLRCDRRIEGCDLDAALQPLMQNALLAGSAPNPLRRRRVMGQLEPPSSRSQLFFIGKDSRGNWVVTNKDFAAVCSSIARRRFDSRCSRTDMGPGPLSWFPVFSSSI